MKTENGSKEVKQRAHQSRWRGVTLAILVVGALSYGALHLWNKPNSAFAAVADTGGESVVIPVEGMTCSACVAGVKKTLMKTEGVGEVHVSLEKREAQIRYDPAKTSADNLAKVIDEMGYKAGTPREKVQ